MEKNEELLLPESIQAKLFDLTGSKTGGSKGFLLFYIDGAGDVSTTQRVENNAIGLSLMKAVEVFIERENENLRMDV